MSAVQLTERQLGILHALKKCDPAAVAADVAHAFDEESDPRGAAQTLRRLRDDLGMVVGPDEDGLWRLTRRGRDKVRRTAPVPA